MQRIFEKAAEEIDVKEFINKIEEKLDGEQILRIIGAVIVCFLTKTK